MSVMEALTKLVVGMGRFGDHLLSRKAGGIIVASLAFACGASLFYALKPAPRAKPAAPPPAVKAPPCETAAPPAPAPSEAAEAASEEWDSNPLLEEWKAAHSGTPLPLKEGPGLMGSGPLDSKVVILPDGRTLVDADDTLYMLGANKRVVWKYEVPQTVIDFAYVKATGLVYVTSGDNNFFILDAAAGRELYHESRNGRAGFGEVLPYGEDACLVMDEFSGYRAGYTGGYEPMQDRVTAWRGTVMLWERDVPPDAELQVVGAKIYAVTKTKTRIHVKEIKAPNGRR